MLEISKKFWRDAYLRNASLYLGGAVLVGFLNYLLSPVLSRLLPVAEFGEFQASLALYTELAMVLGAFSMATVHASTNCDKPGECAAVVAFLRNASLATVAVMFTAMFAGSSYFAAAFQFTSATPFLALAVMLVFGALLSLRSGYLQGQNRFVAVTAISVAVSACRLLAASALVWLGWRVAGALTGIALAQAVGFVLAWSATRRDLHDHAAFGRLSPARVRSELTYAAFALVMMGFVTVLYTADVLVVKRYLSPDVAGLYSAVSAVAKIIIFVTGPLVAVMLPNLKRRNAPRANWLSLRKALFGVIAVGGGATLVMAAAPRLVVGLLMGPKYAAAAGALPPLAVAFLLVAVTNVLITCGLALRQYWMLAAVALGAALLLVLCTTFHASTAAVIIDFLAAAAASLAAAAAVLKASWNRPAL